MPTRSAAQGRLIRARAAKGEKWAKDWIRKYGTKVHEENNRMAAEAHTKKKRHLMKKKHEKKH